MILIYIYSDPAWDNLSSDLSFYSELVLWNISRMLWNFSRLLWNFSRMLWNFSSLLWNFSKNPICCEMAEDHLSWIFVQAVLIATDYWEVIMFLSISIPFQINNLLLGVLVNERSSRIFLRTLTFWLFKLVYHRRVCLWLRIWQMFPHNSSTWFLGLNLAEIWQREGIFKNHNHLHSV